MHHSSRSQGLTAPFQGPAHRLVGDGVDHLGLHQPVREQPHRPLGAAVGRRRAGQCEQMRFGPAVQQPLRARARPLGQGVIQPALDEPPADPLDGPLAAAHGRGRLLVEAVLGRGQQHPRPHQPPGRRPPPAQHRLEPSPLVIGQVDPVPLGPHAPLRRFRAGSDATYHKHQILSGGPLEVARRYLRPTDRVLDLGTGGGERFLGLAPYFAEGVGIDALDEMVATARESTPPALAGKVRFERMRDEALAFPHDSFDVVLCRHADYVPAQVADVLRPGGYFVTQGVGDRNTQCVFDAFGWNSNGAMWRRYCAERGLPYRDRDARAAEFRAAGCAGVAEGVYDVAYYFADLASLVFWLKAVPLPEEFDPGRHWRGIRCLIEEHGTPRGIRTN